MRAGSLASDDITRRLQSDYTCAWTNTEGERNAGGSFAHPPSDPAPGCTRGNGQHNVQVLFLTPTAELLHATSGYLSSNDLAAELTFVDQLWAMVRRAQTSSARKHLVAGAHRRALRALERGGPAADARPGPLSSDGFAMMRQMTQRRQVQDLRYVIERPLLPASAYRSTDHVGRAQSWFGSSRGSTPKASIGTPRPDARRLRRKLGKMDPSELLEEAILR